MNPLLLSHANLSQLQLVPITQGEQQGFMLALQPGDVSSIEELDTYLAGYSPFGLWRADEVAPLEFVDKDTDNFRIMSLNNVFRRVQVETSYQSPVGEVDPASALDSYKTIPRALGSFLLPQTERQSTYDVQRVAANRIRLGLDLDREFRVWTLLTTLGNWATSARITLAADQKWNGGANSDPISDLQTRERASSQPVTGWYMGEYASHAFLAHVKVRDYMKQMLGDNAPTPATIDTAGGARNVLQNKDFVLPGLAPIHIVSGRLLNETTGLLDGIIGNHVCAVSNLGSTTDGTGIRTIQTFRLRGSSGTGFVSREFRDENRGLEGGRKLVAGHSEDVKFVSNTAGGFIQSAIQ